MQRSIHFQKDVKFTTRLNEAPKNSQNLAFFFFLNTRDKITKDY